MPPNEDLNAKVAQQLESLKKKKKKCQKQLCGQMRQTLVIVHKNHKKNVAVKKTLFCGHIFSRDNEVGSAVSCKQDG